MNSERHETTPLGSPTIPSGHVPFDERPFFPEDGKPAIIVGAPNDQLRLDHHPPQLKSTLYQCRMTWALIVLAAFFIAFTSFLAYNSTLNNPLSRTLLPTKPSHTILALNILSRFTIIVLQAIALDVFETVRWVSAGLPRGISAFSFNVLSRATGSLGVLYLLFFNSKSGIVWPIASAHRLWCLIRYPLNLR